MRANVQAQAKPRLICPLNGHFLGDLSEITGQKRLKRGFIHDKWHGGPFL